MREVTGPFGLVSLIVGGRFRYQIIRGGPAPGDITQLNPDIQREGDLVDFWTELISALYDEDLARIIKCCPQPDCRQCVAVRAEMKRRKRKIDHAAL